MKVRALIAGALVGGLISIGGGTTLAQGPAQGEPAGLVANFGQAQEFGIRIGGGNLAVDGFRPGTQDATGNRHVSGADGPKLVCFVKDTSFCGFLGT